MASFRAVASVCEAVVRLLRDSYQPADFNNELEFKVFLSTDFAQPIAAGVSVFLYRVFQDGTHRSPSGRLAPDGQRYRPQLPLDLHFLVTAWGKDSSLQHTIVGWMMRTLEDNPILPATLLNATTPGVFHPDETVEITLGEIRTEDLFQMWEVLGPDGVYQLSIPYVARNIYIESTQVLTGGAAIQQRNFALTSQ
jgi:hypothetical protein